MHAPGCLHFPKWHHLHLHFNAACLEPIYGQLAPMRLPAILFRKILTLSIPQITDIFSLNMMRKEINLSAACRLPLGRSLFL